MPVSAKPYWQEDRFDIPEKFFRELYGEDAHGHLVITIFHKDGSPSIYSYPIDSEGIRDAAQRSIHQALASDYQVYYSLGLQANRPGPGQRGKEEGVAAIPGFADDIDIKGPGHKETDLPTEEEALAYLRVLPIQPTLIVHTGGGLQAYWLFKELWTFDSPEERAQAASMSRRFTQSMHSHPANRWKLDNVASLEHLFRVPGTFNQKLDEPRPVRIIENTGIRYNPADFEQYLVDENQGLPPEDDKRPWDGTVQGQNTASLDLVVKNCPTMRALVETSDSHTEIQWKVFLDIVSHCKDGREQAHNISKRYGGYDFRQCDRKVDNALKYKPRTCANIKGLMPELCEGCRQLVKSPIVLGLPPKSKGDSYDIEEWGPPLPFWEYERIPFPTEVLPDWGHDFVKALSTEAQVPEEMPGLLFLAAVAAAVAKSYRVEARPGWVEQLGLYVLVLLETGNRKSGTLREITAPLYHFEKKLVEEKRPEYEKRKQELDILKQRMEDLKKSYVKAKNGTVGKGQRPTGRTATEIKSDIDALAVEIAATPEPTIPTLITGDITEEKLIQLAAENDGVICNFSAEGEVFANAGGRYNSNNPTFDALLKGYSGDQIRQARIGRAPQYIDNPRFTVAASVQPIILKQLAAKPEFRHKGFLGRFLYAVPTSPLGYRRVNSDPISVNIRNRYWNGILRLLSASWPSNEIKVLRLTADANSLLIVFEEYIEPQLKQEGGLRPIVDWAAKLSGGIVRIAGLLHLADHAGEDDIPLLIDADTMSRAIATGEFLINHCKIAYSVMDAADDNDVFKAKRVLRWIRDNHLADFTQRDCHRALQSLFTDTEDVRGTLNLLVDHDYIREVPMDQNGPGRKRSTFYQFNPLVTEMTELTESKIIAPTINSVNNGNFVIRPTKLGSDIESLPFLSEIGRYKDVDGQ